MDFGCSKGCGECGLTVDATVGTVCAPSLLLGHVDLDVRDVEGVHIQTLHLHSQTHADERLVYAKELFFEAPPYK